MKSNFKALSLGNITILVIDHRGKTPLKLGGTWSSSGYRAISAKNIQAGSLKSTESIRFVDSLLYKKWMKEEIERYDILITSEAPFGEAMLWNSDEKIVLSQRVFGLRLDQKLADPEYVSLYFQTPQYKSELEARATGSTVRGLRQPELLKTKVILPDLPTQKSIAKILGDFDRKIELNRRMNETLEQIGQVLFKKYFIDNPKRDAWEQVKLGDYVTIERGLSYKGAYLNESDGFPMINLGSFNVNGEYSARGIKFYTGDFKVRNTVLPGDLVIANTDITQQRTVLGSVLSVPNLGSDILFTHHVNAIRNSGILSNEFIYFALKQKSFRERAQGFAIGTTVLSLPKVAITEYEFALPNKETLDTFSNVAAELLYRKELLRSESILLKDLRDQLLARLMSGQISL
jgi:type I restriction enzyme S subunit